MLDKSSHMPLYAQLKDELADRIKHGTMSVGSQIQGSTASGGQLSERLSHCWSVRAT
jgi:DNA-binding transcriptional regulator YhcF (GntR family)